MDKNLIEKVDQTIEAVCKCIESGAGSIVYAEEISELANALASLITARANAATSEITNALTSLVTASSNAATYKPE